MDSKIIVLTAVILGLLTGFMVATQQVESDNYCESIEQGIRENQSFNGTVDCFKPGVIPVNISEEIDNRTDLKCVCRNSHQGDVQLFPVSFSEAESAGDR